jgi:chromosome segregation ATPase
MDDSPLADLATEPDLGTRLTEQRRQAVSFFESHRQHLAELGRLLTEQTEHLQNEIGDRQQAVESREEEQGRRSLELLERAETLARLEQELAEQQVRLESVKRQTSEAEERLAERQRHNEAALEAIRNDQHTLSLERQALVAESIEASASRELCAKKLAELEAGREQLEVDRSELKAQRRRIARELQNQKAEERQEIERERAELERLRTADNAVLEGQLAAAAGERDALARQLAEVRSDCDRVNAEREAALKNAEQLQAQLADAGRDSFSPEDRAQIKDLSHQIDEARLQRDELNKRCESHARELRTKDDEVRTLQAQQTQWHEQCARLTQDHEALSRQAADAKRQVAALQSELSVARSETEVQQAEGQRNQDELQRHRDEWTARQEAAEREREEWRARSELLQHENQTLQEELEPLRGAATALADAQALRSENESLVERLAAAEAQVQELASSAGDNKRSEDLQRRLELAMQDLRDYKTRSEELKAELARAKASGGKSADSQAGVALDWEAQKRKLLEALESEFDETDAEQRQDRLTIEKTIEKTEAVIAARDRELEELRQVLEDQSRNVGNVAVGAAAIAGMLDQDTVVQQERDNLRRLQDEWREKLRTAEIDLSVERAKMARERAEIDERIQDLQSQMSRIGGDDAKGGGGKQAAKPTRGRWLSRLGLKEDE